MKWKDLIRALEKAIEHPFWCRCFTPALTAEHNELLCATRCSKCGKMRADETDA